MKNIKLFGMRVKELRKRKKMTQEALGELCGIDCKQIGNIETGTYFTTMPTLEKIATALDVEICELFNFNHNKDREGIESEIIEMVKKADEKELKAIYRLCACMLK